MARQARSTSTTRSKSTDAATEPVQTEEVPVTESTTEAPASNEPAEGTAPEADEPKQIDLAPFQAVVAEVIATRDESTGVVSADELAKTTSAYNELDADHKRASKKWAQAEMMTAVQALDGPLARAYSLVGESLVATGKSSSTSTPADPTQAFVNKVASLRLALAEVEANVPEKVATDWSERTDKLTGELGDQVAAYRTYLATETPEGQEPPAQPEVSPVVRSAFKLATGKASGGGRQSGGSGPRADIAKHVAEVFANLDSGTELKVSEVAKVKTAEYPQGTASQGAISARARFDDPSKSTLQGIISVPKDDNGPNRLRKA